jgi:hypothetical protein
MNCNGGVLVIGVSNDKKKLGIEKDLAELGALSHQCNKQPFRQDKKNPSQRKNPGLRTSKLQH